MLADTWNLDCKLLFFAEDRKRDFDVNCSLEWYICTAWLCNTYMSIKQRLWGFHVIIWHYYCSFCISGYVFSKINAIINFCYKAFNVKRLIPHLLLRQNIIKHCRLLLQYLWILFYPVIFPMRTKHSQNTLFPSHGPSTPPGLTLGTFPFASATWHH